MKQRAGGGFECICPDRSFRKVGSRFNISCTTDADSVSTS